MMIEFQRVILGDERRNDAFAAALKRSIVPGETTVADLGSGTGFLAFLASRLGAKRCYLYEVSELLDLSREIARRNGIKNCTFVRAHSLEVAEPPPVDLVISETLGNFALEENVLETLQDARRFLAPGGSVIPQQLRQFVAPVVNEKLRTQIDVWPRIGFGLDFEPARRISLQNVFVRSVKPADLFHQLHGAAQVWDAIDFRAKTPSVRRSTVEWSFTKPATIQGFALWWECDLLEGAGGEGEGGAGVIGLSTAPDAPATHWEQIFLPALEPMALGKGEQLRLALECDSRPEVKINLKWRTMHVGRDGMPIREMTQDMRKGYLE